MNTAEAHARADIILAQAAREREQNERKRLYSAHAIASTISCAPHTLNLVSSELDQLGTPLTSVAQEAASGSLTDSLGGGLLQAWDTLTSLTSS